MLLRTAKAIRELGSAVSVVAPAEPAETLRTAREAGFATVPIEGIGRAAYARGLRRWDRHRAGVLWCHGLLPSLSTAGHPRRIVHLHQLPHGPMQRLSLALARPRTLAIVVPSHFMAGRVAGSRALPNWTEDLPRRVHAGQMMRVLGFLGRLSEDKGVDVLASAFEMLALQPGTDPRLVVAGDSRFVPADQEARVTAALASIAEFVELRGWTPRDDFFASVDITVFPSVWPESFGLGVAESMAAGVPCVVSDAGALPEVVGAGHPWVAPAGDAVGLACVLRAALDGDPTPIVDRARRRWEAEYSPAAGRARVADLLCDLGLRVEEKQS